MEEDVPPPENRKLTKAEKKAKYRQDIHEPIKGRRELLKAIMNGAEENRQREVRSLNMMWFDEDYKKNVDMYMRAVDTMIVMPDRGKTGGQCLAEWYLNDFSSWLKDEAGREERLRREFLTPKIKEAALKACTVNQKCKIREIFDIEEARLNEDMAEMLDNAIKKQDYSNAASYALQFKLVDKYDFEDLILPLILSGREQQAYKLLEGHTELQIKLVQFLDDLSGAPITAVEDTLRPYKEKNILTVPADRFSGKTLDKLIQTIIGKNVTEFNFHPELAKKAPNHSHNTNLKNLKYNITERYGKGRSDAVYFQHMVDTFKEYYRVREPILHFLWDSNSYEKQIDAISIAMFFGMDHSSAFIPGKMKDFFRDSGSTSKKEYIKAAEELLQLRKERSIPGKDEVMFVNEKEQLFPIIMITNESELNNLCSLLNGLNRDTDDDYVGFDSEWKPSNLTANNTSKIAIIQLFFNDKVWLVDCCELEKAKVSDEWWQKFAAKLFLDNKFKIIGFDMRNDLDAMITIPALKHFLKIEQIKNCFDLKRLAENICDIDMEILELTKKTFKLADLTLHFLNVTLDKTEQCSNWQSRPLRKSQIIYAALDAVVVVDTYRKILERTQEKDSSIDLMKIENNSNVLAPRKEKSSKTVRKLKTIPWLDVYETLRHHRDRSKPLQMPHEIQVIVDTMLLGFGKHLRRCGIDVYLPRDVNDFRKKLKVIDRLGGDYQRHIVTVPSKSYEALKQEYERSVIALPDLNSKPPIDQLIDFFDLFNIDIKPEDEYLRCVECNSRLQIKFPGPVLHFLHQYCVIHLQNVYRADMSEFPLEEWWDKMLTINPADYDGIEVKMSRPTPKSKWMVATVPTGCLHITRQTAIHNNLPEGVEVRIHKVPDDEFQRPNLCFYVCGDCGAVAYDGRLPPNSASTESVL